MMSIHSWPILKFPWPMALTFNQENHQTPNEANQKLSDLRLCSWDNTAHQISTIFVGLCLLPLTGLSTLLCNPASFCLSYPLERLFQVSSIFYKNSNILMPSIIFWRWPCLNNNGKEFSYLHSSHLIWETEKETCIGSNSIGTFSKPYCHNYTCLYTVLSLTQYDIKSSQSFVFCLLDYIFILTQD
jgi:hypothetical protein